jgi:biotin carboxylase
MARVMLLVPSSSYRAPDFMEAAGRLDLQVVVASDQRQTLEALVPGRTLAVDFTSPERGAHQIATFARQYPLQSIVAVDDAGTVLAARASALLGLPHNPVEAVQTTRDKQLLRSTMAAAGVPSPWFRLVPLDAGVAAVAAEISYPCVLKPLSLSGSRGVIRADDPKAFATAVARISRLLSGPEIGAECAGFEAAVLVEGYIPGEEVAVEGLLTNGRLQVLALFDKPDPLVGPFFEETIYVTPSRLSEEVQSLVAATTERSAAALGLRDGPLHAELRINADGAWPVDIAARSIGGLCSRTLSFGTGMSLVELILRHALGTPAASAQREVAASGVMMIPIPGRGVLGEVRGLDAAQQVPGIESVTISIRRGQLMVPLPEGSEYLGFIFARGESPGIVEEALRRAHALLRFEIRPEPA